MIKDLDRAIALHKEGQLDKAEDLYLEILHGDRDNCAILHLLGTLYLQKKILNYQRNIYSIV